MTKLPQHLSLDSKNILVTGATGYLGREMIIGLCELGANVFVNGRNLQNVEICVSELLHNGYKVRPATFDINDEREVRKWFTLFGDAPLHGLVNNAYFGGGGSVETANDKDYRDSFEISLVAVQRLMQFSSAKMHLWLMWPLCMAWSARIREFTRQRKPQTLLFMALQKQHCCSGLNMQPVSLVRRQSE